VLDQQRITVGLIGTTIARSLSPAMHNTAFALHGLQDRYALWSLEESELAARVATLRTPGMRGANVTIPYKSAVLPLLDELGLDPDVRALGAANTIVRRDDSSLLGLNTDVGGFLRALDAAGFTIPGARVVLLGAGGSSRAVTWGLLGSGITSLTIVNRSPERATDLLADLLEVETWPNEPQLVALQYDDEDLPETVATANLLINATPIGTDGASMPLPAALLHAGLFVSDLIYRPTPLLRAAAERGAAIQDGLEMLVQQGALAFEAWTGLAAPVAEMREAALQAREAGT
jgi:shikimate dehydrogenase